jgi:hypothetical protein
MKMESWLVALIIGGLLGSYGAILGCYLYIFNVERNVCSRMDMLVTGMETRLDATLSDFSKKLDRVSDSLQFLRGRYEAEDDSDVRRL